MANNHHERARQPADVDCAKDRSCFRITMSFDVTFVILSRTLSRAVSLHRIID